MSKNKIKVLDRHFCNKLDRKQSNKKERQEAKIIKDFATKLISNSRDIDPEINKIVRKHFWELL